MATLYYTAIFTLRQARRPATKNDSRLTARQQILSNVVFDRQDSNIKMNSRLDTLLKKFKLEYRGYKDKITEEQLIHTKDTMRVYNIINFGKILFIERMKSNE